MLHRWCSVAHVFVYGAMLLAFCHNLYVRVHVTTSLVFCRTHSCARGYVTGVLLHMPICVELRHLCSVVLGGVYDETM